MPTDEPRTPAPPAGPGCPDGPSACLRLLKFYDLNGDGQRSRVVSAADRQAAAKLYPDADRLGDGEPPLEGIAFEIVEWRPIPEAPRIHRRSTDASGDITICFDYPARVTVREVGHVGGGWSLTTQLPDPIQLQCSTTLTLPIGNARLGLPKTGHAAIPIVGGRFGMAAGTAARWVGRD